VIKERFLPVGAKVAAKALGSVGLMPKTAVSLKK